MGIVDRLRYSGRLLAVFAAVLLLVPLADCALIDSSGHAHESVESTAVADILPGGAIRLDSTGGQEHCAPHAQHCVKSLPPALSEGLSHSTVLFLLLAVVLLAVPLLPAGVPGVRGPPALFAVGGRMLLTHFCIDRR